ncbi:hypothetical protein [Cohnella panacarvi]|uniref:hypothetical protein n=1 Tax=Cohnella panacarvi TaxID=400776 RepID=UPI00047EA1B3|nr:hypothetical protein [Cohnella panacarvi]
MLPNVIVERCDVNMTAANIRVRNLTPNIRDSLIQSARLDQWPPIEVFELPDPPKEARYASWEAYGEYVASKEIAANNEPGVANRSAWDLVNDPKYMRMYEVLRAKNEVMIDKWRWKLGYE